MKRSLTLSLAFWIQYTNTSVTDRQTDRHCPTAYAILPRLRTASHGKNRTRTVNVRDHTVIAHCSSLTVSVGASISVDSG